MQKIEIALEVQKPISEIAIKTSKVAHLLLTSLTQTTIL